MPKKPYMEFKSRWLDYVVENHPVREWCRPVKGENRKFRCIYCNFSINCDRYGLRAFKRHASSNRHQTNRMAALHHTKKVPDSPGPHLQTKESLGTLGGLHPKLNFKCTVNLRPVSVLSEASKQVSSSPLVSLFRHWGKPAKTSNPFIDVFICFCGEEFISRPKLQNHKKECHMKPAVEHQDMLQAGKAGSPHQHNSSGSRSILTPACFPSPAEPGQAAAGVGVREASLAHSLPSKGTFVSSLGLIPKRRAAQVCQKRRNTECEGIDLDEEIPVSPSIPRTPKLLISHLSRDGNEGNGAGSSSPHARRSLFSFQLSRVDKEAGSQEGQGGVNNTEENKKVRMSHVKTLYSLDLTSPLGQFVIKHIKGDPYLHVLSDVESHCLTSPVKKNSASIQLRERSPLYPVTFKGFLGKASSMYIHHYKFTKEQRVEFMRRVETGLDKKSRRLFKKMRPCKVHLTHITKADLKKWMVRRKEVVVDLKPLTAEEIKYWTYPKALSDSNSSAVFPSGLSFSSPNVNNVLGLRTCQDATLCKRYPLSVANYVSEETFAEVMENRRAVYKSLLSDSEKCGVSLKTENSSGSLSLLKQMLSSPARYPVPLAQVKKLYTGSMKIDGVKDSMLCSAVPFGDCQNHYKVEDTGLIIGANTDGAFCGSIMTGTCIPQPVSNISHQFEQITAKKAVVSENSVGPVRSGIHDVRVLNSFEGETIKRLRSPNAKLQIFRMNDEENLKQRGKTFRTGNRKMRKITLVNSPATPQKKNTQSRLKKHRINSCDTMKPSTEKVVKISINDIKSSTEKVDIKSSTEKVVKISINDIKSSTEKVGKININDIKQSTEKVGKAGSVVKMPSNTPIRMTTRKKKLSHTESPLSSGGVSKATQAVKVAVQRLSRDPLCPIPGHQEKRIVQICKVKSALRTPEGNSLVSLGRKSNTVKLIENKKSHTLHSKLPSSGQQISDKLSVLTSKRSNNQSPLRNQHGVLITFFNDKLVPHAKLDMDMSSCKELDTSPCKGLATSNPVRSGSSPTRNSRNKRHPASNEMKQHVQNGSTHLHLIDSSVSKNSGSMGQDPPPTTTCPSEHQPSSQKDTFSNGLRFVAYASPLQLRQSSMTHTVSIPRKAEERKSQLSSFLVNTPSRSPSSSPIKASHKSFVIEHTKSAKRN